MNNGVFPFYISLSPAAFSWEIIAREIRSFASDDNLFEFKSTVNNALLSAPKSSNNSGRQLKALVRSFKEFQLGNMRLEQSQHDVVSKTISPVIDAVP
jgi:hypothetical protein